MVPIGVLIHATGTSSPTPYFTPWSRRGGNAAVFVADVIALHLTAMTSSYRVVITVQTKNSEDADASGSSQDVGVFDDIQTLPASPRTKYLSGFKELFRYKVEVYGDASDDWVHMRMLDPSWLRN